jgi:hypothetical protein
VNLLLEELATLARAVRADADTTSLAAAVKGAARAYSVRPRLTAAALDEEEQRLRDLAAALQTAARIIERPWREPLGEAVAGAIGRAIPWTPRPGVTIARELLSAEEVYRRRAEIEEDPRKRAEHDLAGRARTLEQTAAALSAVLGGLPSRPRKGLRGAPARWLAREVAHAWHDCVGPPAQSVSVDHGYGRALAIAFALAGEPDRGGVGDLARSAAQERAASGQGENQ